MNTLTTRKIVLGLLLVLVLAFSVQGTADAADLPLSKTSGDLQTKSVDETFEITFRVGIRSNTTAIRNSDRELIDDGAPPTPSDATRSTNPTGIRIDSSGYPIKEIGGKDYRLTTINAVLADLGDVPPSPTGYGPYVVHFKRPSPFSDYQPYSLVIYANSSRNAFSDKGYPLYYHIPASDENGDDDKPARTTSQIKIQTDDFYDRISVANRYHYNEEKIAITVSKNGTTTTDMTFKLDAPGFQRDITELEEIPVSAPNALLRSVTLICAPTGTAKAGVYTVRIEDATPVADTPWTSLPDPRAYIEFTLYVVAERGTTGDENHVVKIKNSNTRYLRVDTAKEIESVSSRFGIYATATETDPATDADFELRYKVVKGSGTLYAAAVNKDGPVHAGPNQDLTVHQDAKVYLNTNGTDNEVSASIAGEDRKTFGATIVYEYSGKTAPSPAPPPAPIPEPTPEPETIIREVSPPEPRLIIEPSTLTGGPGSTYKLTIRAVDASGTAVSVPRVAVSNLAFIQAGGQVSPVTITAPITANVTLPSTPGQYKLSAAATGYQDATVDITVAAGTLSVLIDPVGGAPGTQVHRYGHRNQRRGPYSQRLCHAGHYNGRRDFVTLTCNDQH